MIKEIFRSLLIRVARFKKYFVEDIGPEAIKDYWKNPDDGHNNPKIYVSGKKGHIRSKNLLSIIEDLVVSNAKILEIGTNAGRNLNELYNAGYKNLSGIEISTNAIEEFEKSFNECYRNSNIINDSVENVIKEIPERSYDIIFSIAVLQHIHTDSEWIFDYMVKINRGFIIVMEDERWVSYRHFPRNYKKIFESRGMRQIKRVHGARIFKIKSDN